MIPDKHDLAIRRRTATAVVGRAGPRSPRAAPARLTARRRPGSLFVSAIRGMRHPHLPSCRPRRLSGRRHPARNPRPRAFVLRSITTVIASKIGVRGTGKYCRSFIGTVCFNMLYWTCLHPGSSLIRHPPPDPRADWTHSPRPTARRTQRGTSRLSGQGSIAARWVYLAASAPLYITGPLATCSSATERCAETVRPPLHARLQAGPATANLRQPNRARGPSRMTGKRLKPQHDFPTGLQDAGRRFARFQGVAPSWLGGMCEQRPSAGP